VLPTCVNSRAAVSLSVATAFFPDSMFVGYSSLVDSRLAVQQIWDRLQQHYCWLGGQAGICSQRHAHQYYANVLSSSENAKHAGLAMSLCKSRQQWCMVQFLILSVVAGCLLLLAVCRVASCTQLLSGLRTRTMLGSPLTTLVWMRLSPRRCKLHDTMCVEFPSALVRWVLLRCTRAGLMLFMPWLWEQQG
jgi:hypothetical protein